MNKIAVEYYPFFVSDMNRGPLKKTTLEIPAEILENGTEEVKTKIRNILMKETDDNNVFYIKKISGAFEYENENLKNRDEIRNKRP